MAKRKKPSNTSLFDNIDKAEGTAASGNGAGGTTTVANTRLISVSGQDGNDTITLDESNGALPAAFITGDGGNEYKGQSAPRRRGGRGDCISFFQNKKDFSAHSAPPR